MTAVILTVFVASLLGNLHCGGMCGPFVALAVGGVARSTSGSFALQAAYHGGRLITYVLLGAACGLVGSLVDLGGALAGVQRVAAGLAGATMAVIGLFAILRYSGVSRGCVRAPAWMQATLAALHRAAAVLPPVWRALAVGLLTTLLPCGWLYAFAVTAAGTGSAWAGALTLAAFWAGTLPVLVAIGVGAQRCLGSFGRRVPLVMALAIMVVGVFTVIHRAQLSPTALAAAIGPAPHSIREAAAHARARSGDEPACCEGGE
ncbi:MAG: sulfite exporter TauE/SafE family protein [Phycisphaerae bacterium]